MYYSYKRQTTKTMAKRYSAQDYRKEYSEVQKDLKAIKNRIAKRLLTLCKANPTVPLYKRPIFYELSTEDTVVYANVITDRNIDKIHPITQLVFIETIEKFLADQHPHKQLEMKFPEIVVHERLEGKRVMFDGSTGDALTREKDFDEATLNVDKNTINQ